MIVIIYISILLLIFLILYFLISILYKIHYSYQLEKGCITKKPNISNKKSYNMFYEPPPEVEGGTEN